MIKKDAEDWRLERARAVAGAELTRPHWLSCGCEQGREM